MNLRKIVGQAAVIVGIIFIFQSDFCNSVYVFGDVIDILSAFVYACFSTLTALRLTNDGSIPSYLFLGLMGFFNMICMWPLFFIFHFIGVEPMRMPEKTEIVAFTWAGFLNLFSNYFWTKSILLTSPFIATLGLSLYIPFVFLIYCFIGNAEVLDDIHYLLGSGCIVIGFVLVNLNTTKNLEQDIDNKQLLNTRASLQEALIK